MRLAIIAVGRLKDGPERSLYSKYAKRFDDAGRAIALGPLTLAEITESRASGAPQRKADEAQRLLSGARDHDLTVVLDGAGKVFSSEAFATWIAARRDAGVSRLAFLIGGADGHGDDALARANLKLSLGAMTLPHGIARIVLAEQLYRAVTILSGHPYHRG
jgi:23S rRNA (pseudouridine1915-N3)-methyltransferase